MKGTFKVNVYKRFYFRLKNLFQANDVILLVKDFSGGDGHCDVLGLVFAIVVDRKTEGGGGGGDDTGLGGASRDQYCRAHIDGAGA